MDNRFHKMVDTIETIYENINVINKAAVLCQPDEVAILTDMLRARDYSEQRLSIHSSLEDMRKDEEGEGEGGIMMIFVTNVQQLIHYLKAHPDLGSKTVIRV